MKERDRRAIGQGEVAEQSICAHLEGMQVRQAGEMEWNVCHVVVRQHNLFKHDDRGTNRNRDTHRHTRAYTQLKYVS